MDVSRRAELASDATGHVLHTPVMLDRIVELLSPALSAPDADAMGLELAAFIAAVRGEPTTIVTASEGRAALALAHQVTEAVRRAPIPALGR